MAKIKSQIDVIKSFILNDNFERLFEFINPNSYFLNFYSNKFLYKNNILSSIGSINKSFKILKYNSINNICFFKVMITNILNINIITLNSSKSLEYLYFVFSKNSKKIDFIISKEEFPNLYSKFEEKSNTLNFNTINLSFKDNLEKASPFRSILKSESPSHKTFSKSNAIAYAEKYALVHNPSYISFDNNGGDCTNFASQILHAGGLPKTKTWYNYSNPWVRVKELRNYLINNNLAKEFNDLDSDCEGALIQFFNPELKDWTHTGFITYSLGDDYLYCCHSYDKLNYPLSLAYPLIYKKIRILKIK